MSRKDKLKIDRSSIKKILFIRLRRIGDIMMTTPAAAILRDGFPEAGITYLVEAPYKDLVEGHYLFDQVIVLPRTLTRREFFRFIRKIRKDRYDLVIDFHGGPKASLISLFSAARLKIGYQVKY
ncbi:MAG: glycosyltransferase family 9 protein, partial [Candidatus Aminicenantes bacterium]|nr:glycosyltransferase family 9 protein [Candidatus Aminicenantes bacterium]